MLELLIVDDQALRSRAWCALIDNEHDMAAVHAPSPAGAVPLSGRTNPDVIIWHTETRQWPLVRRVREAARRSHIVILTDDDTDAASSFRALDNGADSIITTAATPDEFLGAIRKTAAGGAVVPAPVIKAIIESVRTATVTDRELQLGLASLTRRERQVLSALARGWSNEEIAAHLSLARTTVKSHVSHIFHKIGTRNRVQAVVVGLNTSAAHSNSARDCVLRE